MPKILATSKGCYAVIDNKTVELSTESATMVNEVQSTVFIKSGKAKLVTNDASEDELADALKSKELADLKAEELAKTTKAKAKK